MGPCPITWWLRWQDHRLDHQPAKDLHILIDSSAIHTSGINSNNSTPNLSLFGCNRTNKTSWTPAEPIGNSHHLPNDIVINCRNRYQPVIPRRKIRWRCNGSDWSSFTNEVESRLQQILEEPNMSIRIACFNNILTSVASFHIGKTKPSKKLKLWINPHDRPKIPNRNQFHQTIHQNQQEWTEACQEENGTINEAKANSCKDLLHSSMSNANDLDMRKVIQGLNDTLETNLTQWSHVTQRPYQNQVQNHIFVNHYIRISKLHMTKEDRDLNRLLKKLLNTQSVDDESCSYINMTEQLSAIQKMKRKGANSSDHILPTFLKSISPVTLRGLLSIFNASFHYVDCPRIWRVVIIPLLKAGKSPSDVVSFWPIVRPIISDIVSFLRCKAFGRYHRWLALLHCWNIKPFQSPSS